MIDPITLEPIYKDNIHAVSIYKQLYCANSLIDSIIYSYKENIIPTIPHNRELFTYKMLQKIYNKSDNEHKSEILIEFILRILSLFLESHLMVLTKLIALQFFC